MPDYPYVDDRGVVHVLRVHNFGTYAEDARVLCEPASYGDADRSYRKSRSEVITCVACVARLNRG